jgi:hypothetical protein
MEILNKAIENLERKKEEYWIELKAGRINFLI